MSKTHTFHIPVMGIAYTIDTPLKVAKYGVDSVISLVDDILLEKLRESFSDKFNLPFQEISTKIEDFRAKRITAYLDMIQDLTVESFDAIKKSGNAIKKYFNMLPDSAELKQAYQKMASKANQTEMKLWLDEHLQMGNIDVNIMTKVDKENYLNGEKLTSEYNDAHAALRGFTKSKLHASVVLSAGMSPRLYSYLEHFDVFYPNENGELTKKVILKVSDYRSALIQGKFLAKKGIWVSEYRIESGLNCGGHAFATDGFLMGPILEEFRLNRNALIENVHTILVQALENKGKAIPNKPLPLKITAQGGVGTAEEHNFLLNHYKMDKVGWGSPFLLVPEATEVDEATRAQLAKAKEKDLYLSGISPLGVPFNSLKDSSKQLEKQALIAQGKPGSSCPKQYLVSTKEFSERPICTASRQYQRLKLKELDSLSLDQESHNKAAFLITEKECICTGLSNAALNNNNIAGKDEKGITVCPGPNMAYFSKMISFKDMLAHIYGKVETLIDTNRPNFLIKELNLYLNYFKKTIADSKANNTKKQQKYLEKFAKNLDAGIMYYQELFESFFESSSAQIVVALEESKSVLTELQKEIETMQLIVV